MKELDTEWKGARVLLLLSDESVGAEQEGCRSVSQVKGDLLTASGRSLLSLF